LIKLDKAHFFLLTGAVAMHGCVVSEVKKTSKVRKNKSPKAQPKQLASYTKHDTGNWS